VSNKTKGSKLAMITYA